MTRRPAREYRVIVPSYQRPAELQAKTLAMLAARHVPADRITVYLHDNDPHLDTYRADLGRLGICCTVTTERGITAQRERIVTDHPAGTPIVSMDDDLTDVTEAIDSKTLRPIRDLDAWFRLMFTETAGRDLYVWGIAPVPNAYFMRPGQLGEGLKFLMFTLYGYFNRPGHPAHHHTVPYKDEHELSLRAWWWDGATLRADGVAVKAEYYAPGGCQAAGRNHEQVEASVRSLLAQWPGLVRRNTRRRSDWPEIALARRARHPGNPTNRPPPGAGQPRARSA